MSIPVTLRKDSDGWVLLTADSYQDILAGPFESKITAERESISLGLELPAVVPVPTVTPKSKKSVTVNSVAIGCLFRVDSYWYRMAKIGSRECEVSVVGEDRQVKLPSNTEISEVSVLSLV